MFEEDTGGSAVYRPVTDDVPLSRRPRRQMTLSPDGTARVTVAGPGEMTSLKLSRSEMAASCGVVERSQPWI